MPLSILYCFFLCFYIEMSFWNSPGFALSEENKKKISYTWAP